MRISHAKIRNMFGIKQLDYDGKDIELDGKKGVGKSSFIDCIKLCLTNRSDREFVVMKGEEEGEILIEMDSGLSIHRKFRTNKADYKSIKQGGRPIDHNESSLRSLFHDLQLNPLEFAKMDINEQNRIILDLIDFKWDMTWIQEQFGEIPPKVNYEQNILCVLHDIQAEEGHYFTRRQDVNRDVRTKTAFIEDLGKKLPAGYNANHWENFNLGEIYQKIENIRSKNEQIITAKNMVQGREDKIKAFKSALDVRKAEIGKEAYEAIKSCDADIVVVEQEIIQRKHDLQQQISEIKKEAVITKNTLEREILELESSIKYKRHALNSIEGVTNANIQNTTHECNKDVQDLQAKLQRIHNSVVAIECKNESDLKIAEKDFESDTAGLDGEIKPYEELAKIDPTPFDELQQEAQNAEKMKLFINEFNSLVDLRKEVKMLTEESESLTVKIEKARALPGEILEKANIPVKGLTIKDGVPLINGLPISNLSDGEKFELCIDIASSDPSSLQMILLNGIECLPTADRASIYKKLKDRGVQVIASRTTDDDVLMVVEL